MKKIILLPFTVLLILLTSCATIFYGTKQKVKINSTPAGASIFVNGVDVHQVTPAEVVINRRQPRGSNLNREVVYQLRLENYNYVEIKDEARTNYLVGFFSWYPFVLPGLIDLTTAANNRYSNSHNVRLTPSQIVTRTDTVVKREIVYVEVEPARPKYVFERRSDIDRNIPKLANENPRRFSRIIGNEDYSSQQIGLSSEIDVHFARNDASAFRDYAINILGVPDRNITFLLDATTGQIRQALSRMNAITRSTYGEAEIFVYYAGHGLPDETTREPYLIPVDVSGKNAADGIKLSEFYQRLTEHPSKRVTVFVDACFSGGAREQGLLAARGVRVRPRENALSGNLVVFAASSGEQASLPYKKQEHGFFTYHLLKLLKERGPDVSYGEIADYMRRHVEVESILVNEREQTPQVNYSPSLSNDWMNWTFK